MNHSVSKPIQMVSEQLEGADTDAPAPAKLLDFVPEYEKIDGWLKLSEAELLFDAALSVQSGCIVEIGSYRGRSTVALASGSRSGSKAPVFAIEPHEHFIGIKGGAFGPNDRRAFFRTLLQTKLFSMVRLLNTTSGVITPGWDKPIGLLFIDGDHRYQAVYSDFSLWRPYLMDNALVIFNDATGPGPAQLIKELTEDGTLIPSQAEGRLSVLHFRAVEIDIAPESISHQDMPSVYPALQVDANIREPGQSLSTVGHGVYYGGNGSYLYQPIPKCGCTSIKTILLELENLTVSPDEWIRHNKERNGFPGTDTLPPAQQKAIFEGATNTFKFVIVRDPYTRMASVYADKIQNGYKKRSRYWIDLIKNAAKEQDVPLSEVITFEEFVQVVSAQPVQEMDPHWRHQHFEGRFGTIKFDYVGHVEMLSSDLLYILERLKAPPELMHKAGRPHNVTGASLAMWAQVSAEVRLAFAQTFAIDFDTLRYPFRYQYAW
jgi:predicted O-methyltransferase YrrM